MGSKPAFIVLGVLFVFSGVAFAVVYNRVSTQEEALMGEARQSAAEGRAYGAHETASSCVQEVLPRYDACGEDETCQGLSSIYLRACLFAKPRPVTLCTPPPEPEVFAEGRLAVERCAPPVEADAACGHALVTVQKWCAALADPSLRGPEDHFAEGAGPQ